MIFRASTIFSTVKDLRTEIDLVGDGKLLWSTFNVHHFEGNVPVMTVNPAQEGSLFRHCSKDAILAQNNTDPSKGLGKIRCSENAYERRYDEMESMGKCRTTTG